MAKQELHRGSLIDHIGLIVRDLAVSKTFYCARLRCTEDPYGRLRRGDFQADELFVSTADSEVVQGELTTPHLAFEAQDRAMVDAFHRAALAHGGNDNGAQGERSYHLGYYAALVLDPDGSNIEAVFHGETDRSAERDITKHTRSSNERRLLRIEAPVRNQVLHRH
jgi:catechol 2,3-dioxygenase-like lactoylglutathione lyase family enzyme